MEVGALSHLLLALAAGGLSTLNPCVFPLLPLVAGGSLQGHRAGPVVMGLGMVSAFALLGLFVGVAGPSLGIDIDTTRTAGGALLLVLGAIMLIPALNPYFTRLMTPLASGADGLSQRINSASLGGSFLLGGLLGLVWSPCSGPLLISALTLVASEGGALRGTVMLGAFGLGAAIPLIGAAYASRSSFMRMRHWVMANITALKNGFGALIVFLGVAILLNWDKRLEALVLNFLPDWWINLTVAF